MVSIGFPVYNGAQYLRESLDAVLSQTYRDFELIVSDNASTDETELICRDYAQRDARIRYIRQTKNIGALGNFEFVLGQARGKYFMWVAADDLIAADWVAKLVESFRETDFGVFGRYQYISESGLPRGEPATPRYLKRASQLTTFLLPDSCGKCFYIYSLFRREPLAAMKVFAEKSFLGNDQIIVMRFLEHGDLRAIPGGPVMKYRVHDTNTSSKESRAQGAYRRMLFSTFPATYYRHALGAVPAWKRALAVPLVPVKYVFEQARSYRIFAGLLARKANDLLLGRGQARHQAAKG